MTLKRELIQPRNDKLNISKNLKIPHSPGWKVGDMIYLSGMIAIDPETGKRAHGTVESETRQILENIRHMLESAGSSLEKAVRMTVMLDDIDEWDRMNAVYREFFPKDPPARSAIGVKLNNGMKVEIECTALA